MGRRGRAAALAGLLLVAFALLLLLVEEGWGPLVTVDAAGRDDLHHLAAGTPGLVLTMKAVSTLGTITAYAVAGGLLVVHLLRSRRPRAAVFAVVAVGGGSLLNTAVKAVVDRARPWVADPVAHAGQSSFPSGHAQGVVVAGAVVLLVLSPELAARRPVAAAAAGAWALLMGFARVALGLHYVSDVLGGYLLGLAWLAACASALAPWQAAEPAISRT